MRVGATFAVLVLAAATLGASTLAEAQGPTTRFVVGFYHDAPVAQGDSFHHGKVARVDSALGFAVVETGSPAQFKAEAHKDKQVRYLEVEKKQKLISYTPGDPRFGSQYGPQLIGAPAVWDTSMGSSSVSACVVDTGIRYSHEDLAANYAGGIDLLANNSAYPWDLNGHGTHVSGIIGATVDNALGIAGVANVKLLMARALDSTGSGYWSDVATGIRWCADQGAVVVSLSLGGSGGSTVLSDAVDYAWGKGAVVVAAAGNNGPCTNCVLYPAKYANAIAVSCVDSTKALCSFSSTGPEVDLAAPGYSILSTYDNADNGYAYMSGTSMSTPHVAGAVALLKVVHPDWTNQQLRDALQGHAEDLGAAGLDDSFGYGLVRVDLAAGSSSPPPPPPPPPPASSPPDLAVSGVSVAPGALATGTQATFTATVVNQGSGDAGASVVRFLLDGQLLGDVSIGALAAGQGTTASLGWSAVDGSHTVQAVADATSAVVEADETNNAASAAFSVAPRGVAVSPASQAGSIGSSGKATYTFTVTNNGPLRDTLALSLSGATQGWKGALSAPSLTLAAGASGTVTVTVSPPGKGSKSGSSTLTLTASSQADPSVSAQGTMTTTR